MKPTTTPVTAEQAVATYPELAQLAQMIVDPTTPRWEFRAVSDGSGVIIGLIGIRLWRDGTRDMIGINSATQARVVRTNPLAARVFERVDTVPDVVDVIRARLVDPTDPLAPCVELPRQVAGDTAPSPACAVR